MIKLALEHCEDTKLYLAINLAFACSMREGEILGLPWDNVFISDDDIANAMLIFMMTESYKEHP